MARYLIVSYATYPIATAPSPATPPPAPPDFAPLDLRQAYTYSDYVNWPCRDMVELVRGRVVYKPSAPVSAHHLVSSNLHGELYAHLKRQRSQLYHAPFDVRLLRNTGHGPAQVETVVKPDLCVVCAPTKIDRRGCLGAPDWIIEVVSPCSMAYDTKTKYDLYAEHGVAEFWLVYPGERAISTFALRNGTYEPAGDYFEPGLVPSRTLPDLELHWADVFAGVG